MYPSVKVSASTEVTLDIPEPFRDDPWLLYPQVKLSVYTEATLYVPRLSRIALWPVYPHVKVSITVLSPLTVQGRAVAIVPPCMSKYRCTPKLLWISLDSPRLTCGHCTLLPVSKYPRVTVKVPGLFMDNPRPVHSHSCQSIRVHQSYSGHPWTVQG